MREPGFHADVSEADYHGDMDSLSVSGAKLILKAPALYRWRQDNPEHKDVFDIGHAAHALVLGVGAEVEVVHAADWRTKDAREAKAKAHEAGRTPLLAHDWQRVCDMADVLASHTLATRLLSEGEPEVSAYALDETTGVVRRGRFDWLGPTILSDYKTAASSEPGTFGRAAYAFGYHMQAGWYLDLARDLGHPAQAFAFIVQEKEPPYMVTVADLDSAAIELGRRRNREALDRYAECVKANYWPTYIDSDKFTTVSLPGYAYRDEYSA